MVGANYVLEGAALLAALVWLPLLLLGAAGQARRAGRSVLARRQSLAIAALTLLVLVSENSASNRAAAQLYYLKAGSIRAGDVLIVGLALIYGSTKTHRRPSMPFVLRLAVLITAAAAGLALLLGVLSHGQNFFHDLRSLLLGAAVAWALARGTPTTETAAALIRTVVSVFTGAVLVLWLMYAAGGGYSSAVLGGRTPTFDGPTLSVAGCLAIFSTIMLLSRRLPTRQRWWHLAVAASNGLLVLVAFRRTYWAELIVAGVLLVVFFLRGSQRAKTLTLAVGAVAVLFMAAGPARTADRLGSAFDSGGNQTFAATNSYHYGDVADAWSAVKEHPALGVGLGVPWSRQQTRYFSDEAVGVHNGPLFIWLRLGILGVAGVALWTVGLFRWVRRKARLVDNPTLRSFAAAFAIWTASSAFVSCFFSPPQIFSTQLCVFMGIGWGVLFGAFSRAATPIPQHAAATV